MFSTLQGPQMLLTKTLTQKLKPNYKVSAIRD